MARTLWGNSFNGTSDIDGKINAIGGIECNGILISLTQDKRLSSYIIDSSNNSLLYLNYYSQGDIELCYGGGRVGIGITSPTEKLDVNGSILSREYIKIQAFSGYGSGNANIWFDGNNNAVEVMNNFKATGGITAYSSSDIRLKTNLRKADSLSLIKSLGKVYEFDYKKSGEHSIGLIAQNVQKSKLSDLVANDDEGFLKLNYWSPKLISLALGGVVQVDGKVTRLKKKVKALEKEVKLLKEELSNNNINLLN